MEGINYTCVCVILSLVVKLLERSISFSFQGIHLVHKRYTTYYTLLSFIEFPKKENEMISFHYHFHFSLETHFSFLFSASLKRNVYGRIYLSMLRRSFCVSWFHWLYILRWFKYLICQELHILMFNGYFSFNQWRLHVYLYNLCFPHLKI